MNKNLIYRLPILLSIIMLMSGCQVVDTIFKAGMVWAFFLVFIGIVVILWLFNRSKK